MRKICFNIILLSATQCADRDTQASQWTTAGTVRRQRLWNKFGSVLKELACPVIIDPLAMLGFLDTGGTDEAQAI